MVARHSKQTPIPHSGPRGSPVTDFRVDTPVIRIAAATVVPELTVTGTPFTFRTMERPCSDIGLAPRKPCWQIWTNGNLRCNALHMVCQHACGSKRRGDTQSFVAGRKKQGFV